MRHFLQMPGGGGGWFRTFVDGFVRPWCGSQPVAGEKERRDVGSVSFCDEERVNGGFTR